MQTVYDTQASNYYEDTEYSLITYWDCGDCGTKYTHTSGESYHISTDYNSFEGDISWMQCKTNCYEIWDNG